MIATVMLFLNLLLASCVAGLIASFWNRAELIRSSWALQQNHRHLAWGLRLLAVGYGALSGATLLLDRLSPRTIITLCLLAYPTLIGGVVAIEAATWRKQGVEERRARWGVE